MPALTIAAAAPPTRRRVYFEESERFAFLPSAVGCHLGNAWWLAEASLAAYENFQRPETEQIDLTKLRAAGFSVTACTVGASQFLAIENPHVMIVAFRGTRLESFEVPFLPAPGFALNWADVLTDLQFAPRVIQEGSEEMAHQGFLAAFKNLKVALGDVLAPAVSARRPIWFCGHSLGAALATLAAYHHRDHVHGLYTFGSPRVGNEAFVTKLAASVPEIWRFVHHRDLITSLPGQGFGKFRYAHVGQVKTISGQDTWRISDEALPTPAVNGLAAEALAYSKQVAATIKTHFAPGDPGSWPIAVEALADHSPMFYANKIFNAYEENLKAVSI